MIAEAPSSLLRAVQAASLNVESPQASWRETIRVVKLLGRTRVLITKEWPRMNYLERLEVYRNAQDALPVNRGFLLHRFSAHLESLRKRGPIHLREWMLARAYVPACEAIIQIWDSDATRAESVKMLFDAMPDEESELTPEPDDDEIVELTHRRDRMK